MQNRQPSGTGQGPKVAMKAVTPGHLVVSAIVTALIAAGDAGFQYIVSNGGFSLVQFAGVVLTALFATLGTGVISLEKNPTIQQAIDGSLGQYVSAFEQLLSQHAQVVNQAAQVVSFLTETVRQQVNSQAQAQQQQPAQTLQAPAQRPQAIQQPIQSARQIPAVNLADNPVPQVAFPAPTNVTGTSSYMPPQSQTINFGTTGVTPIVPGK